MLTPVDHPTSTCSSGPGEGIVVAAYKSKDELRLSDSGIFVVIFIFDTSGKAYNTVSGNDISFYHDLNEVVKEEPIEAIDAETRGLMAAIGIVKGQPFAPDDRMKKILADAAAIGDATARAIVWSPRQKGAKLYPDGDSAWNLAFTNRDVFFEVDGARNLDARTMFYYAYTAVTPAMAKPLEGQGSDYGIAYRDAKKQALDGSKTYKLHLPPRCAGGGLLGSDRLRRPDPVDVADRSAVPDPREPERRVRHEKRRLVRPLLRPEGSCGQGRQLAPDHPWQELVLHPTHVRATQALARPDLAAGRARGTDIERRTPPSISIIRPRFIRRQVLC
jgi:hypothetical protein